MLKKLPFLLTLIAIYLLVTLPQAAFGEASTADLNPTSQKITPDDLGKILPQYTSELSGNNEIRIYNPNKFSVTVGVRDGNCGKNLLVPENSTKSIYVADGQYDIYFVYSNDPQTLLQGDRITLHGNGILIKIVSVVGGNFSIKKVN
jgi:hypothetical protein